MALAMTTAIGKGCVVNRAATIVIISSLKSLKVMTLHLILRVIMHRVRRQQLRRSALFRAQLAAAAAQSGQPLPVKSTAVPSSNATSIAK